MKCIDRRAAKGAPRRFFWRLLAGALPVGFLWGFTGSAFSADGFESSVFRVEAEQDEGGICEGSAVLVAPGVLLTNCHVVQKVKGIQIINRSGQSWRATLDHGDAYRDICALRVPDIEGDIARRAPVREVHTGLAVQAVGFSGRRFQISNGMIKGLHPCACDGGKVIQTSASFDPGASGGGLFDADGRLVGMLTFKNRRGGDYHFAVPIAWYGLAATRLPEYQESTQPFWQGDRRMGNLFLTACALGAQHDWKALHVLAESWKLAEPDNPEPWVALGRAEVGMANFAAARHAFEAALELDSTHGDATWELQKLDLESGTTS